MKYDGRCHCGNIRFEVEGEITAAMACNCCICSRQGSLLWFVPRARFKLLTPEDDIGAYTFNKHVVKHRFLPDLRHSSVPRGHPRIGRAIPQSHARGSQRLFRRLDISEEKFEEDARWVEKDLRTLKRLLESR